VRTRFKSYDVTTSTWIFRVTVVEEALAQLLSCQRRGATRLHAPYDDQLPIDRAPLTTLPRGAELRTTRTPCTMRRNSWPDSPLVEPRHCSARLLNNPRIPAFLFS